MRDALKQCITEVVMAHERQGWAAHDDPRYPYRCPASCGIQFRTERQHAVHLANKIAESLQLRLERSYTAPAIPWLDKGVWEERLVTDWQRSPGST